MKQYQRKALSIAIGTALLSITTLPALAVPTHAIDSAVFTSPVLNNAVTINNVEVFEPMTSITNDGNIDADSNVTALEIQAGGSVATLTNTGTIESDLSTGDVAIAIYITDDLSGVIDNSGVITAKVEFANSVEATAIYVNGGITATGSLRNSGSITATAIQTDDLDSAEAYGVFIEADLDGSIVNDGNITVSAENTYSDATAAGIYVAGELTGSITNNGEIKIEASGTDIYAATGIYANDISASGSILNTGAIVVNIATAEDRNSGAGIYVAADSAGSVINSGNITLTSTVGGYEDTNFHGIHVGGTLSGTITNTSTGVIDVSRTSTSASSDVAGAVGINVDTLTGTLNNHGDIIVTDIIVTENSTAAFGVHIDAVIESGVINNSGNIIVTGENEADATGVYIGTLDGTFNNSGTISASVENISASFENGNGMSVDLQNGKGGTGRFNNSGLITGNINIRSSIAVKNSGTIALRSIHDGSIAGVYTQTATGILQIGASDTGQYGSLRGEDTMNFEAGTGIAVAVDAAHTLVADDVLQGVIEVREGFGDPDTGTLNASSFTVTDNNLSLAFASVIYGDTDTVDLTVTETGLTTLAAVSTDGGTEVLDRLIADNPTGPLAFAFGSLSTVQAVEDAVESTGPNLSGGASQLTNLMGSKVTGIVITRQDSNRGLSSGDALMSDKHFWLKPFGNWTEHDDRQGVAGYEIDSYGLAAGFDGDVSPTWNVGFALAYINSDVDSKLNAGKQTIDIDSYLAKVYATNMLNDVTALNLQLGAGMANYDGKRRLFTNDVASSDYDSWQLQASAELERSYAVSAKTVLTPYVHADYSYVDVESYNESGAGALNLNVASDSADSLVIGAGVKANHTVSDAVLLVADAGLGYDVMTDRSNLTASFAGGGANFTTQGIEPDEFVYKAGVGAKYSLTNGTEITARYDFNGRQDYTDQSVSANFRVMF